MNKNIVQKILDAHIVNGTPQPGREIGLRIDQTLIQDATGTMACLQFEALGFERVKTELSVSYVDHNTIQDGFENADDHAYLESVAARYGMKFSRPGNGICHQVHLERFGVPGKTLLGSDSHTPTAGGIGMLAVGAGGLDVAAAMGGGPFDLVYPRVIRVDLQGELSDWVSAKDIVLKVLEILSTKGNVGYVLEYGGRGVACLSVPERATITNMGAETGVTTSVFPSDEQTKRFLAAQQRAGAWSELRPDPDAKYDREITVDLSALEPLAACPHSPGNVKRIAELSGMRVDQVLIGSCTNASLRDIMTVAAVLKGRKVSPSLSLGVACGSRQVLEMAAANGALAQIAASGARILENACGFCIGNSLAPGTNGVSVRTSNRNFYGRSGTNSADIYLTSPESAAAAALAGELTDPREFFAHSEYPRIEMPDEFAVDDSMITEPAVRPERVVVARGPNIGEPPQSDPLPEDIDGVVSIVLGDNITTDDIMPAGNRLKYRSNIPEYAKFVFERRDPEFADRALANKSAGLHNLVVAGESYGQGSSREHAAICPACLGVGMVVAKSIERIHWANLINSGIVPALFENPADLDDIAAGKLYRIAEIRKAIEQGKTTIEMRPLEETPVVRVRLEFTDRERSILLAGGKINTLIAEKKR